ncbi:MAG: BrnT family toxin [Alphaproteobacteria bacterium]|nr:BrnT family toxin [Alphaproteobacteria bacterium]
MKIGFDEAKSERNRRERGFGFELAYQFDFETAVIVPDDRCNYGEERSRAFGRIVGLPFCVVFTMRSGVLRVISMRRVHIKEAKAHGI